jgi:hypothetical protein
VAVSGETELGSPLKLEWDLYRLYRATKLPASLPTAPAADDGPAKPHQRGRRQGSMRHIRQSTFGRALSRAVGAAEAISAADGSQKQRQPTPLDRTHKGA